MMHQLQERAQMRHWLYSAVSYQSVVSDAESVALNIKLLSNIINSPLQRSCITAHIICISDVWNLYVMHFSICSPACNWQSAL